MNRQRVEGKWKQFSGQLKVQWGRLTRDSGLEFAGRRDQIAGRAQEHCGISKERAERQLRDFLEQNRDWYLINR